MLRTLSIWFHPVITALFRPGIPFKYRWRLLLLQPLSLLTVSLTALPWAFSNAFTVYWIPTREGRSVRALVFQPHKRRPGKLHPLHLDIHGGAFIGGLPEYEAKFTSLLSERTGAVVISAQYRYAPAHPFPAAIDDIDDVVRFLHENAERLWGADPSLMTVSGFSAGGNLALASCQQPACHPPASTAIKASVTFYASIDLRLKPWEKPKPPNFPKRDPVAFLMPLFDAYASPDRAANMENPRLSPITADVDNLPENMLLIIAGIDILLHEQLMFVERVKRDLAERGQDGKRRVEGKVFENGFHGWLELPVGITDKQRKEAYDPAIDFLKETHRKYNWRWD